MAVRFTTTFTLSSTVTFTLAFTTVVHHGCRDPMQGRLRARARA